MISPDCQEARRVHAALSTWERRLADEVARLTRKVEVHPDRSPAGGLDLHVSIAALDEVAERLAGVRSSLHEIEASCDSATNLAARLPASECPVAILVPSPRTGCAPQPRRAPRLRWSGSPLDDIFRRGAAHEAAQDPPDDEPPLYGAYGAPVGPAFGPLSGHLFAGRDEMSASERLGWDAAAQRRATQQVSRAAAARSPILANAATVHVPGWAEDNVARRLIF